MSTTDRTTTRERILQASRTLFNKKGYAATTLAEIAKAAGLAPGNLTYHFPTKVQLVTELQNRMGDEVRVQRARYQQGPVVQDYVELLLFAMRHAYENRFLLRDRAQFANEPAIAAPDMAGDLEALHGLLVRAQAEGLFRRDIHVDLRVVARALWITSRYWLDHLREFEGIDEVTWDDLERGVQHHFAMLLPYLNKSAQKELETALLQTSAFHQRQSYANA
ncbi:MAG: TetR family transcriptional regulator [Pseudomonadota bacterium]